MKYMIRDKEAGNEIATFNTLEEAQAELEAYEEQDKADGTYEEEFYEIAEVLDAADRIKKLRRQTGLSQQKFADRFGIPMRTVQNWEYGVNEAPDYLLDLLEQAIEAEHESRKPDLCKLTIHYKNGNTLVQNVWYAHIEENMLAYTRYQNPAPAFQEPTRLTLEHIESFSIEPLPKSETAI